MVDYTIGQRIDTVINGKPGIAIRSDDPYSVSAPSGYANAGTSPQWAYFSPMNDGSYAALQTPSGIPMPAAPDMTDYYNTMAENQQFQNEIAAQQLDIAERQQKIAEERYEFGKTFRPVEKSVIEQAERGLDPTFYSARQRNAVIQSAANADRNLAAANAARGVSPGSGQNVSGGVSLAFQRGGQMGAATTQERERIEGINLQKKQGVAAMGSVIPGQVVEGYGTAAGVAGQAGAVSGRAAAALANQYATEQQVAMQYQQLAAQTQFQNAQLALQGQGLQQQMSQNQQQLEMAEQQSKDQLDAAKWGAIPIVGPIVGATTGGTYICTELLRQKKVSVELYRLAIYFDEKLSHEMRDGYCRWAKAVAYAMYKSRLLTTLIRPLAIGYMSYAAARVLQAHTPLLGSLVYRVGGGLCYLIGRLFPRRTF